MSVVRADDRTRSGVCGRERITGLALVSVVRADDRTSSGVCGESG